MIDNSQDALLSLDQASEVLKKRQAGKERLYSINKGRVVVEHISTVNALCKFIATLNIDNWIKKVLIMRIGAPLIHKKPMTHLQIALKLGMKEEEVKELEAVGIEICNEALKRTQMIADASRKTVFIEDTLNKTAEPLIG